MYLENAGPVHQLAVDDDWSICRGMSGRRRSGAGGFPSSLNSDAYVPQNDTYVYLENAVPVH